MRKTSPEYQYLDSLFADSRIVELRAIKRGKAPMAQWHNDTDSLIATARGWAGDGVLLCTTMALPCHYVQRETAVSFGDHSVAEFPTCSLRDEMVLGYGRLLFDFDRKEKATENATDDELSEAGELRSRFVEYMAGLGWPAPALATSGNGLHALYRVAATPYPELHAALGRMYRVLGDTFQSERFKLDTTTHNPAQLCRLYGAINRKFPPTDGRPQRLASITMPDDWMDTNFMFQDMVLEQYPEPPKPRLRIATNQQRGNRADWTTLDIVSWFRARGLYMKQLSGGKHAVICPWQAQGDHSKSCDTDTVVWETSSTGYPSFHCAHDTCSGRGSLVDLNGILGGIEEFCR